MPTHAVPAAATVVVPLATAATATTAATPANKSVCTPPLDVMVSSANLVTSANQHPTSQQQQQQHLQHQLHHPHQHHLTQQHSQTRFIYVAPVPAAHFGAQPHLQSYAFPQPNSFYTPTLVQVDIATRRHSYTIYPIFLM